MTISIFREQSSNGQPVHVLERKGGRPPSDWVMVINPSTFEPMWIPPGQDLGAFGVLRPDPAPPRADAEPIRREKRVSAPGVWFQREKYTTHAHIKDLRQIPRFVIDDPSFGFDSHEDNPGWMLVCKQRHFNGKPGKLTIKLVHESPRVKSTVHIRPSNHNLHRVVETEADFVEIFQEDFAVESTVRVQQVHRPLAGYTDDELLAELRKRSEARLAGWRPRKRSVDLTNVINLDDLRVRTTTLDMDAVERIVAA